MRKEIYEPVIPDSNVLYLNVLEHNINFTVKHSGLGQELISSILSFRLHERTILATMRDPHSQSLFGRLRWLKNRMDNQNNPPDDF